MGNWEPKVKTQLLSAGYWILCFRYLSIPDDKRGRVIIKFHGSWKLMRGKLFDFESFVVSYPSFENFNTLGVSTCRHNPRVDSYRKSIDKLHVLLACKSANLCPASSNVIMHALLYVEIDPCDHVTRNTKKSVSSLEIVILTSKKLRNRVRTPSKGE